MIIIIKRYITKKINNKKKLHKNKKITKKQQQKTDPTPTKSVGSLLLQQSPELVLAACE